MNKELNSTNFIIVLGTTKSGSSAVFDYLSGRGDLRDPLRGQEYHLPQMPNGLMTLEAIAKDAFHPGTADYALSSFEEITKKLSRSQTKWSYGMGYSSKIPSFQKLINQFIEDISAAKIPMKLHWRKLLKSENFTKYIISKLINHFGFNEEISTTRILNSYETLIESAQKLHNELFQINNEQNSVILNQAGSGWNPIESTKYFLNRKIILSTRDPRDQFAELKIIKKASSAEEFVNWYKEMQRRLEAINSNVLLKLRFEDFVYKNEKIIQSLCKHASINSEIVSKYDPNNSKKNIGKYKKFLTNKEIEIIKNSLSKYFYDG